MRLLFPLGFLFLVSCSSQSLFRSAGPYSGGSPLGEGTYYLEAFVEPRSGDSFRFTGVFQRLPKGTLFSAVTLSGRPAFRVRDNYALDTEPRFHILASELESRGEILRSFYRGFRPLLLLQDRPEREQPLVKERYPDQRPRQLSLTPELQLVIEEFDWAGHAFRLSLEGPSFRAKLTLREYLTNEPETPRERY